MSKLLPIAKLTAQPGKRDELAKGLQVMLDQVESETGTLLYILHADNARGRYALVLRALHRAVRARRALGERRV